jgi:hydrogenase maturation protease
MSVWGPLEGRAPRTVAVGGVHVGRGSLVRLRPRPHAGGDVFDAALAGQTATVESIQQDLEGGVQLAVVLEQDPGRDLGIARQPGHRFFVAADEVEPLDDAAARAPDAPSVLVAGIGNVLIADDGFGVAVAQHLAQRELPAGVKVADYGIRGMDLAYELQEDYDAAILVDAVPAREAPGTLFVIEHGGPDDEEAVLDVHGMTPVRVLALARALGSLPERILVVGCEPAVLAGDDEGAIVMELSPPVRAAIPRAVELVESLLGDLLARDDARKEEDS